VNSKRIHGKGTESIRKLSRTGKYSYYVTIPKAYIDILGWRERQRLVVTMEGDRLIVRDEK